MGEQALSKKDFRCNRFKLECLLAWLRNITGKADALLCEYLLQGCHGLKNRTAAVLLYCFTMVVTVYFQQKLIRTLFFIINCLSVLLSSWKKNII